jgi:DNA-binding transcriptional LysR family regulator
MELRQLRYFVAIAESNFSRAAERLHIAQPALSRQVRDLEGEIGSPLFIRGKSKLELTPSGTAFLKEAKAILEQTAWAIRAARLAATGQTGLLRVGYVATGLYSPIVQQRFRRFRELFPDVHVALEQMAPVTQLGALVSRTIDVALIHKDCASGEQFHVHQLLDEPMDFMFPADHRLVDAPSIVLADLADESFIMISRHISPVFYDRLMAAWLSAGFSPRVTQESDSFATSIVLVASGAGVSFTGRSAAAKLAAGIAVKPISDFNFRSATELVWTDANRSPILDAFISIVGAQRVNSHAATDSAKEIG